MQEAIQKNEPIRINEKSTYLVPEVIIVTSHSDREVSWCNIMEKPKDCQDIFFTEASNRAKLALHLLRRHCSKYVRKSRVLNSFYQKNGLRARDGSYFGFGQGQDIDAGINKR
ncbi:MAG: hypothetical protein ACYC5X_16485 [Syntrophales bacterium]